MKITRTQLRQIIRESMGATQQNVLYVRRSPYGISASLGHPDAYSGPGEPIPYGEMVRELLNAGDTDFFSAPQGVDEASLQKLVQKDRQGVQGGLHRWDPDVFSQYYNVDDDRVLRLYARLKNYKIEDLGAESY